MNEKIKIFFSGNGNESSHITHVSTWAIFSVSGVLDVPSQCEKLVIVLSARWPETKKLIHT